MRKEEQVNLLLSVAVFGGIAAVAYADSVVVTISLGYLYILPLAFSALVHRLRVSLSLAVFCVALHDVFGPFEEAGWLRAGRNLLTLVAFVAIVLFISQLGAKRRRLAEMVRRQRDELQADIRMAARVQRRLLPAEAPKLPGFDIAAEMFPANTVGGDCFDYVPLGLNQLGLAIADVSGKGVAAALLMSSVGMAMRMASSEARETEAVVELVNQILFDITEDDRYATLFYARLDTKRRQLQYTNAGHLPPLFLRSPTAAPQWLEKGGTVVGLDSEVKFASDTLEIQPGGLLVLYTDGITEAENPAGEQYSRSRLTSVVRTCMNRSAREVIEAVRRSVMEFAGTKSQKDDITLLVLKAIQVPQRERAEQFAHAEGVQIRLRASPQRGFEAAGRTM